MTQAHEQRAHARLGASSAHRWMNCPGSARATDGLDSSSIYAAEGTAAHELAERVLNGKGVEIAHDFIGTEIVVGNHVFEVDEEMADAVQAYVEAVEWDWRPDDDVLLVEKRFSLEEIRHGMFGTNDALRYRKSTKALTVFDYKHGIKPVDPTENPQLMYYALGAALNLQLPLETIELVIVQPRAFGPPVKRWTTDLLTLVGFASDLGTAADATGEPNAPLIAGSWCKDSFCPAAGTCTAYRAHALKAAQLEFATEPTSYLSNEDLAAILDEADTIDGWIKAVWAEANKRANAGDPPPGFKLVPKIARRKWVGDPADVAAALEQRFGLSREVVHQDPKLKSPAQLEKLLPKGERAELAEFYEAVSSGATLARDTDKRDTYRRPTAAEDFNGV